MISTEYISERASSLHFDVDLVSSGRVNHADEQSPLPAAGTVETSWCFVRIWLRYEEGITLHLEAPDQTVNCNPSHWYKAKKAQISQICNVEFASAWNDRRDKYAMILARW